VDVVVVEEVVEVVVVELVVVEVVIALVMAVVKLTSDVLSDKSKRAWRHSSFHSHISPRRGAQFSTGSSPK